MLVRVSMRFPDSENSLFLQQTMEPFSVSELAMTFKKALSQSEPALLGGKTGMYFRDW